MGEKDGSARPQGSLQSAELGRRKGMFLPCLYGHLFSSGDKACLKPYREVLFSLVSLPASAPECDQT